MKTITSISQFQFKPPFLTIKVFSLLNILLSKIWKLKVTFFTEIVDRQTGYDCAKQHQKTLKRIAESKREKKTQ